MDNHDPNPLTPFLSYSRITRSGLSIAGEGGGSKGGGCAPSNIKCPSPEGEIESGYLRCEAR
jgi:hypothetical protein